MQISVFSKRRDTRLQTDHDHKLNISYLTVVIHRCDTCGGLWRPLSLLSSACVKTARRPPVLRIRASSGVLPGGVWSGSGLVFETKPQDFDVRVQILHDVHEVAGDSSVLQGLQGMRLVEVVGAGAFAGPSQIFLADVEPLTVLGLLTSAVLSHAVVIGMTHLKNKHCSSGFLWKLVSDSE